MCVANFFTEFDAVRKGFMLDLKKTLSRCSAAADVRTQRQTQERRQAGWAGSLQDVLMFTVILLMSASAVVPLFRCTNCYTH